MGIRCKPYAERPPGARSPFDHRHGAYENPGGAAVARKPAHPPSQERSRDTMTATRRSSRGPLGPLVLSLVLAIVVSAPALAEPFTLNLQNA